MDPFVRQRRGSGGGDLNVAAGASDADYQTALSQERTEPTPVSVHFGEMSPGTLEQGGFSAGSPQAVSGGAASLDGTGAVDLPVASPFHSERVRSEVELLRSRPVTLDDDGRRAGLEIDEAALGDKGFVDSGREPDYASAEQGFRGEAPKFLILVEAERLLERDVERIKEMGLDPRLPEEPARYVVDLPKLAAADLASSAVTCGNWLAQTRQVFAGLSPSASVWFGSVESAANASYQRWLTADPLERLAMDPSTVVANYDMFKYQRVESRAVSLLLSCVSANLKAKGITEETPSGSAGGRGLEGSGAGSSPGSKEALFAEAAKLLQGASAKAIKVGDWNIDEAWLCSAMNASSVEYALIDSGATNALRYAYGDELKEAKSIRVDLASGVTELHVNEFGTLLSPVDCQLILPAGYLVQDRGRGYKYFVADLEDYVPSECEPEIDHTGTLFAEGGVPGNSEPHEDMKGAAGEPKVDWEVEFPCEVLRTVSLAEAKSELELWIPSATDEVMSLEVTNKAVERIEVSDLERLVQEGRKVVQVPGKAVLTRKAGIGKRRFRCVACGNYIPSDAHDPTSLYASGVEGLTVRTALGFAAYRGWAALSADIRTAFLHAPLADELESEEVIIVRPPSILVEMKILAPNHRWRVLKALYGLRQAPLAWARFRDKSLRALTFQCGGVWYALRQGISDDSLWFIVKSEVAEGDTGRWHGILIIYVDDLLGFASSPILKSLFDEIQKLWQLSDPEWIREDGATKFCGLEIQALEGGGYRISQYSYLKELFVRYGITSCVSAPLTQWSDPEDEQPVQLETIREAQAMTGALLWASSKSRPDIAFAVSKLGQFAVKAELVAVIAGIVAAESVGGVIEELTELKMKKVPMPPILTSFLKLVGLKYQIGGSASSGSAPAPGPVLNTRDEVTTGDAGTGDPGITLLDYEDLFDENEVFPVCWLIMVSCWLLFWVFVLPSGDA
ncbi:putative transposon protein [Symbiodinium microadriaticum]|uniref:Putative transposon protein n=1 Tax=Symbiodinium microadriaticum TaxID=2951 RepID=A0A1Q9DAN9_SYMMI|nr:putative transposon protein [Symbiodinium microadriaticum]